MYILSLLCFICSYDGNECDCVKFRFVNYGILGLLFLFHQLTILEFCRIFSCQTIFDCTLDYYILYCKNKEIVNSTAFLPRQLWVACN